VVNWLRGLGGLGEKLPSKIFRGEKKIIVNLSNFSTGDNLRQGPFREGEGPVEKPGKGKGETALGENAKNPASDEFLRAVGP